MIYKGDLYGRVGRSHFRLGYTADDWDNMAADLDAARECLREALDCVVASARSSDRFARWSKEANKERTK